MKLSTEILLDLSSVGAESRACFFKIPRAIVKDSRVSVTCVRHPLIKISSNAAAASNVAVFNKFTNQVHPKKSLPSLTSERIFPIKNKEGIPK